MKTRLAALLALFAAALAALVPASALWGEATAVPAVAVLGKNGLAAGEIPFSQEDFLLTGGAEGIRLTAITVTALPDPAAGVLEVGGLPLSPGDQVAAAALDGLTFRIQAQPEGETASFTFRPTFSDGAAGGETQVVLHLLTAPNAAPIAQNLQFRTYRNVAIQGTLTAIDPEGDEVTFQITDPPARGSVELSDTLPGTFTYTPYENKGGKDTFSYVAVDSVGNLSNVATVRIEIEKARTALSYADMEGHAAHRAALRLAEAGVFTGERLEDAYFFHPDLEVSRSQFLAMAMAAGGVEALEGVEVTGFYDDGAIPAWAKGYVSSALREGLVTGSAGSGGQAVFRGEEAVTAAEAAVILDRVLGLTDVSLTETVSSGDEAVPAWAAQAVANLRAVRVLPQGTGLDRPLTRAGAAELLCAMLDRLEE